MDMRSADVRANQTLQRLLTSYDSAIEAAASIKEVTAAITKYLPPGLAYDVELRVKMFMMTNKEKSLVTWKRVARNVAHDLVRQRVCHGLPYTRVQADRPVIEYTREDIIKWFTLDTNNTKYFTAPEDETVTVEIKYGDKTKVRSLQLTEDQMIGIVYALVGLNDPRVTLTSSITQRPVEIKKIVNATPLYYNPIDVATEKLKRPYTIEVVQPDGTFKPLHFVNPEFIQGILSVAQWYGLPNQGRDILWKNLTQFTREGVISLEF